MTIFQLIHMITLSFCNIKHMIYKCSFVSLNCLLYIQEGQDVQPRSLVHPLQTLPPRKTAKSTESFLKLKIVPTGYLGPPSRPLMWFLSCPFSMLHLLGTGRSPESAWSNKSGLLKKIILSIINVRAIKLTIQKC